MNYNCLIMRVVWRWRWWQLFFDGTDDEDDDNKMTTTMMMFSMMSKMIRLSTRIAVWTQHHEQYQRQQAQLRTRPTKASAEWGCTAHHNNETTGRGRGRAPPQAPPHRGGGGDTMGWGGGGGAWQPSVHTDQIMGFIRAYHTWV